MKRSRNQTHSPPETKTDRKRHVRRDRTQETEKGLLDKGESREVCEVGTVLGDERRGRVERFPIDVRPDVSVHQRRNYLP